MKKVFKSIVMAMFFTFILMGNLFAQITLPSLPDNYLVSASGDVNINNAMLNYCPTCTTSLLFGVTFQEPSTNVRLILNDGLNTIPLGIMSGYSPDVILGNSGSSTTSFKAGVVYLKGGNVYLSIYDISYPGSTLFSATLNNTYQITTSGNVVFPPHVDIIADAGNTSVNGLPYCDNFIITYVDQSAGVYGYYSSLNNPSAFTSKNISTSTAGESDIAAIQRGSVTPDDLGLFVYTDGSGNTYYREWNVNTGSLTTPLTVDASNDLLHPRIDAVDDYNKNSSSTTMNWEIVGQSNSPVPNRIAEYNNLSGIITMLTSSSTPYSGCTSLCPGVAAGPIATTIGTNDLFTLSWNSEGTGIAPNNFAQTIDRTTGSVSPSTYYQVNYNSNIEVSNQCITNTVNAYNKILICWYYNSNITYKITDHSMAFKPGATSVSKISIGELNIYPNPAMNSILIKSDCVGAKYCITDAVGRQILIGYIQSKNQQINIANLAKGDYLLIVYSNSEIRHTKFVKE